MSYLCHMRTTIELPDELLSRAKTAAAVSGLSLREFFMDAVRAKLAPEQRKVRKAPPAVGVASAKPITALTREQIDAAMFG